MDTGSEVCFNSRFPLGTLHHLLFFVHTFVTCIRMPLPRITWKVTAFPDMRFAPWKWPYSMDTGSEVCFNPRCPLSTLHHLLFSDTHSQCVFECRCLELSGKWRHFRTYGFHHNNSPIAWTQFPKFVLFPGVPLALSTTFYFSDTYSRRVFVCGCLELSGKWRHFRRSDFHYDNGPIAWTQVPKSVLILGVPLALSTTFYYSNTHSQCVFECRCLELSGKWRHFRTYGFHHNTSPIAWTQVPKFF